MLPRTLKLLALAAFTLHTFAQAQFKPNSRPVIIDTDIGDDIDDAFALSLALRTPSFNILGITTTFGDTQLRAHLVAHLLDDAHRSGIPIAAGAPSPSKTKFTQAAYANADHRQLSQQSAVDLILSLARKYPHKITLIAIGPLNNIGAAIDRDPTVFRMLTRVVLMGGSIKRGYGLGPNSYKAPSAEWNIVSDIPSARKLFASGVPIFMMPLDATQVALPPATKAAINASSDPLMQALSELMRESGRPTPVLYDPVTVAFAANPALAPWDFGHIEVDDKGFTRETPGNPNAGFALKSDEALFLQTLSDRLLH
ncbi:MAG: nucleoside hydrolase [Acidobacteriota bacterium]